MREAVENILGYKIPGNLYFVLQSGIVRGYSAKEIAEKIRSIQQEM